MNQVLFVIDYQNDFVTGALGFTRAAELEKGICKKVKEYLAKGGQVVFTLDTHKADYLKTREGKHLPVEHCLRESEGWQLYGEIAKLAQLDGTRTVEKGCFGAISLADCGFHDGDRFELVGIVTNMCVISNAVVLQTAYPNSEIVIDASLCASFDQALHEKALDVMEGLQMQVLNR